MIPKENNCLTFKAGQGQMKIEIDDRSGFCFGVVRAIEAAEGALAHTGRVFSLGDIVHNRVEVERLRGMGLVPVGHDSLPELAGETVLIRAHGEPPQVYDRAAECGVRIVDATCPVVAGLQQLVSRAHADMREAGGQVVILGKKGHAEVVGLCGHAGGEAIVAEGVEDLDNIDFTRPVFLLSQTTQSLALFEEVAATVRSRADDPDGVTVRDTICRRVSGREGHLREFSARFDVVVFVSGRKSSNGRVLFEVCRSANPATYMVEDETELRPEWFAGVESAGVCGATSTPRWLMERVAERLSAM